MRAAQTAVVIGEDNRRAQEKDAAHTAVATGERVQEKGDEPEDVADPDETVVDGSLVDGSDSSPRGMPSTADPPRRRKNSGASAVKVRMPRATLLGGS